MVLESQLYEDNTFATLSYDDEHLPQDLSVSKREVQLFMKRLRKNNDRDIRYFAVGEYGSQTMRPHYHLVLFNYPNCLRGYSAYHTRDRECCAVCTSLRQVWGRGQVCLTEVSIQSAAYVAGYVVKNWLHEVPDFEHLTPEFTLKSQGLGKDFAWEIASSLMMNDHPVVPFAIRHNGTLWPLGRYIREKVAEYSELPLQKAPEDPKMCDLSNAIYGNPEIPPFRKASALREAVIQTRYHKGRQVKKKIARKQKERVL